MARKHLTDIQLEKAQTARFRQVTTDARVGVRLLKDQALEELEYLTNGRVGPKGRARIKALRAAGHPFGRRVSGDVNTGKRGIVKGRTQGKRPRVGNFPTMPVGMITGALDRSRFATIDDMKLTIGFNRKAGKSIHVMLPAGTKYAVGRGIMLPRQRGEFGARMSALHRAFSKAFFAPLTKP